jgi:hypothetical protein
MFLDDLAHRATNAFRFVPIEARGFDRVFQLGQWRVRITFRGTIFPKQSGRDHVDASIGGLRRENGRYEELQWVPKIQFAMRGWINFRPGFQKVHHALASGHVAIIPQGGWRFQSDFGINGADGIYSGVGEGEGEVGCVSEISALGEAMALIFFLRASSRRRCSSAARSSVPLFLSAVRGSNSERSRMRA